MWCQTLSKAPRDNSFPGIDGWTPALRSISALSFFFFSMKDESETCQRGEVGTHANIARAVAFTAQRVILQRTESSPVDVARAGEEGLVHDESANAFFTFFDLLPEELRIGV